MYITPYNDWHVGKSNFSLDSLNFTFNVTQYELDYMLIKLNFADALQISPMTMQDSLVFHVKHLGFNFISATHLIDLNSNFTTLHRPIKKQMPDTSLSRNMVTAA